MLEIFQPKSWCAPKVLKSGLQFSWTNIAVSGVGPLHTKILRLLKKTRLTKSYLICVVARWRCRSWILRASSERREPHEAPLRLRRTEHVQLCCQPLQPQVLKGEHAYIHTRTHNLYNFKILKLSTHTQTHTTWNSQRRARIHIHHTRTHNLKFLKVGTHAHTHTHTHTLPQQPQVLVCSSMRWIKQ